ncbi:sirohydrochlorin chelatase [Streptomyces sp. XD-27]|uniref:sirohydrochlorin chelatase n=1 Tax=Streptomyces sp. XD-27 TaxID=3062779 RepID=UPI0026F42630|nr:sirohydrochlorin chelatase [Streptomyces sp. XD-27]WKX69684.1 sirohydrochlorin chelatase [Streptomyces sp. XD-27]
MTTPPALLLAGHGTQDDSAAAVFRSFIEEVAAQHPHVPVAGGLIEPGAPSIADAVARLAGRGAERLAVVSVSLVGDARAERAVAAELADALPRHPGLRHAYAGPLGPRPKLLTALEQRLDEALGNVARRPSDRAGTTVLLVGKGSTDPAANAEVHRAARLLWEGRGFAGVETAFVSLAAPDVASGLDRCARLGARRVVVAPYELFAGALTDRAWQQAEGWSLAHPEVAVVRARPVGPVAELVETVMERYAELVGEAAPRTDAACDCRCVRGTGEPAHVR